MSTAEDPAGDVTTYTYAPVTRKSDELRVQKETDAQVTNYLWDGENLLRETDDLGAVDAEYTLAPQPYGDLISQRRDAASSFYHYDALGSTRSLTDSSEVETGQSELSSGNSAAGWLGRTACAHGLSSGRTTFRRWSGFRRFGN